VGTGAVGEYANAVDGPESKPERAGTSLQTSVVYFDCERRGRHVVADVFISYSKEHPQPTRDVAAYLELQGYSVWWDKHVNASERFRDVIDWQLELAKAVIVIWTAHSVTSKWVLAEAERADSDGKLISMRTNDLDVRRIPIPYNTYHTDVVDDRAAILRAVQHAVDNWKNQQAFNGAAYLDAGNVLKARSILQPLADMGQRLSMSILAASYDPDMLKGASTRTLKDLSIYADPVQARNWYRKAAELGDADARRKLDRLSKTIR
jgi:hypothetical protein